MPGRGRAVVAGRAVGVGRLVRKGATAPAGVSAGHRLGVAGGAVDAVGRDVAGEYDAGAGAPLVPWRCTHPSGRRRSASATDAWFIV